MNKYLHLGSLVAALSLGCANSTAGKPAEEAKPSEILKEQPQEPTEFVWPYICDKIDLQDGVYNAGVPTMPATYVVRIKNNECGLLLGIPPTVYVDTGCDNTVDFVFENGALFDRAEIAKMVPDISLFDLALQLAQQFACKENQLQDYVK